jgi:hypothetical protein
MEKNMVFTISLLHPTPAYGPQRGKFADSIQELLCFLPDATNRNYAKGEQPLLEFRYRHFLLDPMPDPFPRKNHLAHPIRILLFPPLYTNIFQRY